ncbi:MAG: hypothetical protein OCD00_02615 [Colwellia sp.]
MQYHFLDENKEKNTIILPKIYTQADHHVYQMAKIVAVISYLTIIGWFVAIVLYGNHKSRFASFHLRQSLGLIITTALLTLIPFIGWLFYIAVFIAWLYVTYCAILGQKKKVPLLGDFYQQHLDFIK